MILPFWHCYWAEAISAEYSGSGRILEAHRMDLVLDLSNSGWREHSHLSSLSCPSWRGTASLHKDARLHFSEKPLRNHSSYCVLKQPSCFLPHFIYLLLVFIKTAHFDLELIILHKLDVHLQGSALWKLLKIPPPGYNKALTAVF